MAFKIDDRKILKLYEKEPEVALELLNDKYKDLLNSYDNLCGLAGFEKKQLLIELVEEYKNNANASKDIIINKYSEDCIGKGIIRAIDVIVSVLYESTSKEISLADYREYLFMVVGRTDEQLKAKQQERFNYLIRPLENEADQIYDSLNILETYIFDFEGDGGYLSFEQKSVINTAIAEIRELMEVGNIELAKVTLVSLQMLLGLDVRFYGALKDIIFNNLTLRDYVTYGDEKGKGRIK